MRAANEESSWARKIGAGNDVYRSIRWIGGDHDSVAASRLVSSLCRRLPRTPSMSNVFARGAFFPDSMTRIAQVERLPQLGRRPPSPRTERFCADLRVPVEKRIEVLMLAAVKDGARWGECRYLDPESRPGRIQRPEVDEH